MEIVKPRQDVTKVQLLRITLSAIRVGIQWNSMGVDVNTRIIIGHAVFVGTVGKREPTILEIVHRGTVYLMTMEGVVHTIEPLQLMHYHVGNPLELSVGNTIDAKNSRNWLWFLLFFIYFK